MIPPPFPMKRLESIFDCSEIPAGSGEKDSSNGMSVESKITSPWHPDWRDKRTILDVETWCTDDKIATEPLEAT